LPDNDIILEKTGNIQRCLHRIKEVTQLNPERLEVIDVQDIFVLNLQRAIQSAIDLANHIISSEGWGLPRTLKESFETLAKKKVINQPLATQLKKMVGFRNIAIHDYSKIDVNILKSILKTHLVDLERFYMAILQAFNDQSTGK